MGIHHVGSENLLERLRQGVPVRYKNLLMLTHVHLVGEAEGSGYPLKAMNASMIVGADGSQSTGKDPSTTPTTPL